MVDEAGVDFNLLITIIASVYYIQILGYNYSFIVYAKYYYVEVIALAGRFCIL